MNSYPRFSLFFFSFIFILINSCDENKITLDSNDFEINYFEESFIMDINKSSFINTPNFNVENDDFNQSLSPRLHIGNIGYSGNNNISYALFEINPNIINNYSLCDSSLISVNDVFFTLKFDNQLYDYSNNNDLLNNSSQSFDDLIEENSDHAIHLYINSYFSNNIELFESNILLENNPNAYDSLYIENIINSFKQDNFVIPKVRNTNYKVDLKLSDLINNEDWCNGNLESFYILVEYNSQLISSNNDEFFSIISTDNTFIPYQPKLSFQYNKQVVIDSLITDMISISDIRNSTMVVEATDTTSETVINTLENPPDIYLVNDNTSLANIDNTVTSNIVAININNSSDNFGGFLGYQSPNLDSTPIISTTNGDIELFDIEIDINEDFNSDSIRFYFSDIIFGYQNINHIYDLGESYDDFGIDKCINRLETGDILFDELNSENLCLCGLEEAVWDGVNCSIGIFTGNIWDQDLSICFKDNNLDSNYSLCSELETAYNPSGTENNGVLDWNDNGDGIWQDGEGEKWLDLGLDWIQGTSDFGADDNYETGCKTLSYQNGIGYLADEDETYSNIVDTALEEGTIDSIYFHDFSYEINNGDSITICGQKFWDNPQIDGLSPCQKCSTNDPNGDNRNIDPSEDDWLDLDGNFSGNGDDVWDEGEPFENNNRWDWIDSNENGEFDYCLDDQTDCDQYEPFLDFGINQLPDNLEGDNFAEDNFDEDNGYAGTENNFLYDLGEVFFDTGIDGKISQQEEGFNLNGIQGNKKVDFDNDNNDISEYKDYGLDNCPNQYESNSGICNDSENLYLYDLHLDDFNIDPNNDNYTYFNTSGTENNNSWDYEDFNGNGSYDFDEEILSEYTNEGECISNNYSWENLFCYIDSNMDGQYTQTEEILNEYNNEEECILDNYSWENSFCYIDSNMDGQYNQIESSEIFDENSDPLSALVNVGQNIYYYNLSNSNQNYDKPINNSIYGQDVFLWISKIENQGNNKILVTLSINSLIDVKGFQFKLNYGPYFEQVSNIESSLLDMIAYDFIDDNGNNQADEGELNDTLKYIHDVSLYPIDNFTFNSDHLILSYTYGMNGKLYFDDLNQFMNQNNQSIFISEQQTNLVVSFNLDSQNHYIDSSGAQINFSGIINDEILIADFLEPQIIFDDTDEISLPIGSLINEILENSNQIFDDPNNIIDEISYHLEISLDKYSNIKTAVVIDSLLLPQIDILYSK